MNGMDIEEWNPKTDKYLTLPYDVESVYAGKAAAKEALQVRGGGVKGGGQGQVCMGCVGGAWEVRGGRRPARPGCQASGHA